MSTGPIPRNPSGDNPEAIHAKWLHDQAANANRLIPVAGQVVVNTTKGGYTISPPQKRRSSGSAIAFALRYAEYNHLICRRVELGFVESSDKMKITSIDSDDIYVLKPYPLQCGITKLTAWGSGPAWTTYDVSHADASDEPYMVWDRATNFPDTDTRPPISEENEDAGRNEWGELPTDYDTGNGLYQLKQNVIRTVDSGTETETWKVVPIWRKGDIIFADELEEPITTTLAGRVTPIGSTIEYIMREDSRVWAQFEA